jgi:hypothetical protein
VGLDLHREPSRDALLSGALILSVLIAHSLIALRTDVRTPRPAEVGG